jgi:hypothetical protein
MEKRPF